jgi:hypothetical protein
MQNENANRPADTKIELVRMGEMLTVAVPAMGFRGPAGFMLWFSIVWTTLSLGGFIASIVVRVRFAANVPWMLHIMAGVFSAVGIASLVAAFYMARRRTALVVASGAVTIRQESIFGAREKQLEGLQTAQMGESSMKINNVPVPQLKLMFEGGRSEGLLTGLPVGELKWIATEIRRALGREE